MKKFSSKMQAVEVKFILPQNVERIQIISITEDQELYETLWDPSGKDIRQ